MPGGRVMSLLFAPVMKLQIATYRGSGGGRLNRMMGFPVVLLTTKGDKAYHRFAFRPDDTLLLGRETAGVPDAVHRAADARLRVPLQPGQRSLNLAVAAALVLGEALRQTDGLPRDDAT